MSNRLFSDGQIPVLRCARRRRARKMSALLNGILLLLVTFILAHWALDKCVAAAPNHEREAQVAELVAAGAEGTAVSDGARFALGLLGGLLMAGAIGLLGLLQLGSVLRRTGDGKWDEHERGQD